MAALGHSGLSIEMVEASACTIPTDAPESDGTLEWSSTTIVLVECSAGGERGLGYSYT
ncbi:MAG: enolase C-terminal domain-like protein, partial [Thermoanaerobaculia bacterium]